MNTSEDGDMEEEKTTAKAKRELDESGEENNEQDEDDAASDREERKLRKKEKKRKVHRLSLEKTNDFNERLKKRGVIYVARIPPRMTPTKIKLLLQDFGSEVTRVYLVEEDAAVRRRRRKLSGNGSKRYTEGWVELADKKIAKHVAASLHMTPMSNYKRNHHCNDLWNLKYLHKFQWSYLTEKVAYERRVREQKLRLETMQARRETAAYKQLVETGQKLDKIQARKERKALREERKHASKASTGLPGDASAVVQHQRPRSHNLVQPIHDDGGGDGSARNGDRKTNRRPLLGSLV